MQRLVICCDGTWNRPDTMEDGLPVATNVVKLAEAVPREAAGTAQRVYYDAGVGTRGSRFKRWFEGAFGMGLSRNILEAYRFIIRAYRPGDHLFLFGFSRGAFTVRSLAGLIRNSGVLGREHEDLVHEAYKLYKDRSGRSHPRAREAVLFRRAYAVEETTVVHFIGVWDTVGALGNPLILRRWGHHFHDTALSSTVRHAYHALAIDEQRLKFKATLWNRQPLPPAGHVLEQKWFVGAHSNVGGGYADSSLSDISLDWMAGCARNCGLVIGDLAVNPDPLGHKVQSRQGGYLIWPRHYRPIDGDKTLGPTNESIHASVMQRYRDDSSYRPRNLVRYLEDHPEVARQVPAPDVAGVP
jgi:uncharacterized protein (DUF2235 family)